MTALPAHASGTHLLGGDLPVYRMGFGAMRLTGPGIWGEPADRAEAVRVMERVLDLGVTFVDTADCYGPGVSEEIVAEVCNPRATGDAGDAVIGTKGGLIRSGTGMGERHGSAAHLRAACLASRQRLGLDQIPLYQLHAVDPSVPFEESVGTLSELRLDGLIRHIGLSNVRTDQLLRALELAPIASVQNRYNLSDRRHDEILGVCEERGIAFLPWAPLAVEPGSATAVAVDGVSGETGASARQVVLAWMLAKSPVMVVIPGTSRLDHAEQNVAAATVTLSIEQFARIDAASGAAR